MTIDREKKDQATVDKLVAEGFCRNQTEARRLLRGQGSDTDKDNLLDRIRLRKGIESAYGNAD